MTKEDEDRLKKYKDFKQKYFWKPRSKSMQKKLEKALSLIW